ncbi:MAG: hypothetical protein KTR19_00180 [Hyphomicrobiales bacterium]|nr:hypothetical protein [Hyphomicrobiales bacterium]
MSNRKLFASILMVFLIGVGLSGAASVANAASISPAIAEPSNSASGLVIDVKRYARTKRIPLPLGPSYTYYDYPYYYSRGFYPEHIGGYVYYPSSSSSRYNSKYFKSCVKWHKRCAANWGRKNNDYYGCMNYHNC